MIHTTWHEYGVMASLG